MLLALAVEGLGQWCLGFYEVFVAFQAINQKQESQSRKVLDEQKRKIFLGVKRFLWQAPSPGQSIIDGSDFYCHTCRRYIPPPLMSFPFTRKKPSCLIKPPTRAQKSKNVLTKANRVRKASVDASTMRGEEKRKAAVIDFPIFRFGSSRKVLI